MVSAFFAVKSWTSLRQQQPGVRQAAPEQARGDVHSPCPCPHLLPVILPHRDGERGTSGQSVPALPSPELELHPASPLPSLLIPVVLSPFFFPFLRLLSHHITWFAAPSYRM